MSEVTRKFLNCFAKYKPNDNALWLLDLLTDFKTRINRENRIVVCNCTAKRLCDCDTLKEIEQQIKRVYDLSEMKLLVSYPSEFFDSLRFSQLVDIMHQRRGFIGNGFFEGASGQYDKAAGVYTVTLAPGQDAELLRNMKADSALENTALEAFGVAVRFVIESGGAAYCARIAAAEQALRAGANELFAKKSDTGPEIVTNSFAPAENDTVTYIEDGIECGRMRFDISEPKLITGKKLNTDTINLIRDCYSTEQPLTICGEVFKAEKKESRDGDRITFTWYLTDDDCSVVVNVTENLEECGDLKKVKEGTALLMHGRTSLDKYRKEYVFKPGATAVIRRLYRRDTHPTPRIELHLHTTMSQMDGMSKPHDLIRLAKDWRLPAVCVTDHGNVQAFPDLIIEAEKQKYDGKLIFGMEGYLVDDTARASFGHSSSAISFTKDEFIIFDIETTGLSATSCAITEIAAVKYRAGEEVDSFETYADPGRHIPEEITKLTGITDEMVKGAPSQAEAVRAFLDFADGSMLVAHNASFDIGFIRVAAERASLPFCNPYLDTLALSRYLNPELKRHRLDNLRDHYKLGEFNHHRALDDTRMLCRIFACMCEKLASEGIRTLNDLELAMEQNINPKKLPSYHVSILVQNKTGLHNLYQLVSDSYLRYFSKHPRIPKTALNAHREGLIIGSACESGELYSALIENKPQSELLKIADFYDYFEVMPLDNNMFLVDEGRLGSDRNNAVAQLREFNRRVIEIANKQKKPAVATGDVHFLEPGDEIYRQIMQAGMKMPGAERMTRLYFRTTQEMLDEFSYLGAETARKIVIDTPAAIADMIEPGIRPIPEGAFNPSIEGSDENLRRICHERAKELYGENVPELILTRLDKELDSVINNGYSALYMTARELVAYSEKQGYLVGSRGSVGSSLIATFAGISEVNPLPPHYRCPKCLYSEFVTDTNVGSGFDLKPAACPRCGTVMEGNGQDIPFETFLGFKGDKAPDIDLNMSGEVQSYVHKYTEVLFGAENVFRAGTISTLASKTAYGFVKKYLESKGQSISKAEEERLVCGCMGVKRTTGQHPGGIVVVPRPYHIQDFTPVQHPADKDASNVITTHFAFDYLHDTLQKLDILGHDVPTRYHVLEELTGVKVKSVPMNDPEVMSLFESTAALGIKPEDIDDITLGTLAIPECGTENARQMLLDAKPKTFADLMQISGLSHGEGIWQGNGKTLIANGVCTISEVIGTRDSIMLSLIKWGLEPSMAFKIMEDVRKGRGLKPEYEEAMTGAGVPAWYIRSCKKIQYMFPKAHAAAYMIAALRLGWYKVHRPLEHYASYFTVQPSGFEAQTVMKGKRAVMAEMKLIKERIQNKTNSPKDADVLTALQIVNEMYARGIKVLPVDIYKSHKTRFLPENGMIRLPLSSLAGLGESAADNIYRCIHEDEITSLEELKIKAKLTQSVVDTLKSNNCLGELPESEQLSIF